MRIAVFVCLFAMLPARLLAGDGKPVKLVAHGTLEPAEATDIVWTPALATRINRIVDHCSMVKRGELIAELDQSPFMAQYAAQKITADKAKADWIKAEQQFEIGRARMFNRIEQAKSDRIVSELRLKEYLGHAVSDKVLRMTDSKEVQAYLFQFRLSAEDKDLVGGEYLRTYLKFEAKAKNAQAEREKRLDDRDEAKAKQAQGLIDKKQLEVFEARLTRAELKLRNRQSDIKLLMDHVMPLEAYRRWADSRAKDRLLDQANSEAEYTKEQLSVDRQSLRTVYLLEQGKLQQIEENINVCHIYAPRDGMVLHGASQSGRGHFARGDTVKPGQMVLRIADPGRFQMRVQLPKEKFALLKGEVRRQTGFSEALRGAMLVGLSGVSFFSTDTTLADLRLFAADAAFAELRQQFRPRDSHIEYPGQPVEIRVAAFPGKVLQGHVKSVALAPITIRTGRRTQTVVPATIAVDGPADKLRPGMSAEAIIQIER